jgi:hypothetical protein
MPQKARESGNPTLVSTAFDFNLWNIGKIMTGKKKLKHLKAATRTLKRIITF